MIYYFGKFVGSTNEKYGSQKDLLLSIGIKDLVNDIENFEKVEYTTEDKTSGNGIIPLENTVSAEQIKLGKKYGVSYTLEDFIKEYDAELASLDTTQPSTNVETDDNTKTPIEGLNERLNAYGNTQLVLSSDFFEGERPKGKLNGFKSLLSQLRENIIVLADVNWNDFNFFLSKEDIEKLNDLKPLAEELDTINSLKLITRDLRTVAVEKRYAALTAQLSNEFIDIIGKHVEQQLGKKITTRRTSTNGNAPEGLPEIDRTPPQCP